MATLPVKSVLGQTTTIAHNIDPMIIQRPIIAGKISPGNKKSSSTTNETPNRKTKISSCPANPDTYFDPKKIKTKTMPAIPKNPKPGVLNSINKPSNQIPIIIGPIEFSQRPTFSAQFISILLNL